MWRSEKPVEQRALAYALKQESPSFKTVRFNKAYVIKEALLSSSIEGIHTTLFDVVTQLLSTTRPSKETQLVMNYTQALEKALELMQVHNLPVSSRMILQAHKALMSTSVTGSGSADPGNYRKQSVRVGIQNT